MHFLSFYIKTQTENNCYLYCYLYCDLYCYLYCYLYWYLYCYRGHLPNNYTATVDATSVVSTVLSLLSQQTKLLSPPMHMHNVSACVCSTYMVT